MKQRDFVLVPFPFSDQTGLKVRPVIILSNDEFNKHSEDFLVCGITSNISKNHFTINLTIGDLEEGNLYENCVIKAENILKIEKRLIIKKIGTVKKNKFLELKNKIISIF